MVASRNTAQMLTPSSNASISVSNRAITGRNKKAPTLPTREESEPSKPYIRVSLSGRASHDGPGEHASGQYP